MSEKNPIYVQAGRKGGFNRAKKLSPERRMEIAKKAWIESKKVRKQRKKFENV